MAEFVANGVIRFDAIVPARRQRARHRGDATTRTRSGLSPTGLKPPAHRDAARRLLSGTVGHRRVPPAARRSPGSSSRSSGRTRCSTTTGRTTSHRTPATCNHSTSTRSPTRPTWPSTSSCSGTPTTSQPGEGGTRFVPGSHLRRVRASGLDRYHHIAGEEQFAGPAGTVVVFHHGLWHAGQPNPGDTRTMDAQGAPEPDGAAGASLEHGRPRRPAEPSVRPRVRPDAARQRRPDLPHLASLDERHRLPQRAGPAGPALALPHRATTTTTSTTT